MRSTILILLGVLCAVSPAPAQAEVAGWGLRLGVADDPDQAIAGVQLDLGEIVEDLWMRPDVQLGIGDDHTILALAIPVHYRFDVDAAATPYAGGGLVVGVVDRDRPRRGEDDTDVEIALEVIGGLEWALSAGRSFSLELNLVVGDLHDVELLAGWRF